MKQIQNEAVISLTKYEYKNLKMQKIFNVYLYVDYKNIQH